jgi:hypothetical protein
MTSTRKMESNTNNAPTLETEWKIPREMVAFVAKYPRLLPGESEDSYRKLFVMMVDEIEPQTASEYLVTADITGLFWDIGRYRAWKDVILSLHRRNALETALRVTNHYQNAMVGEATERKEAEEWRADPAKREILRKRLADYGYDEEALNAGALLEALVPLATIDRFLASARGQLKAMLKEVYVRREFIELARNALDERVEALQRGAQQKQIAAPN